MIREFGQKESEIFLFIFPYDNKNQQYIYYDFKSNKFIARITDRVIIKRESEIDEYNVAQMMVFVIYENDSEILHEIFIKKSIPYEIKLKIKYYVLEILEQIRRS